MNRRNDIPLPGRAEADLRAELDAAGVKVRGKAMHCFRHKDEHPSAGIYTGDDGVPRFKCHSCGFCGDALDVKAEREGKRIEDVVRDAAADSEPSRPPARVYPTLDALRRAMVMPIADEFKYTDPATGRVDLLVFRCTGPKGKEFRQAHPAGAGWTLTAPPKPWPLYNRSRVAQAQQVVVAEGEKCCHIFHKLGIVATTSPAGQGKAALADWRPLSGKRVILWPDNDKVGLDHMAAVAELLRELPGTVVSRVDPGGLGLPPKGDIEQFLDGLQIADPALRHRAVMDVLADAEPLSIGADLVRRIEEFVTGERRAEDWPGWSVLSRQTKALLPGTLTVICGTAGDGKSFLVLQAAKRWHEQGIPIALYELEEDREYWLQRALAQVEENGGLTDDEWLRANPDAAREAALRQEESLGEFGKFVWQSPERPVDMPTLGRWVQERCAAGARIVIVDPVTVATVPGRQWEQDLELVLACKTAARTHGASVILVTHPRGTVKRGDKVGLESLAGGAAYPRQAQTVLWLRVYDPPKVCSVRSCGGTCSMEINRALSMMKTRNSRGAGASVGFIWHPESLLFAEQGLIVEEKK